MNKYLIIIFCLLSVKLFAHGGEDHGEKKEQTRPGKGYFTINSTSDLFELVLRYEPITVGKPAVMKLFVSDFWSNKAIDKAKIEITSLDDSNLKFVTEQMEPGVYSIESTFQENKSYSLVANISAGEKADLMTLEGIEVGKKLPIREEDHKEEKPSLFSWQSLFIFFSGIAISLLLFWFFLRKKKITIED